MTYDEALERIDAYLAGDLPLEAVQELEAALIRDPLLALAVGLRRLEPLAGDQLAEQLSPMELGNDSAAKGAHLPRLWLLSLLAGSVVIGSNGQRKKKHKKAQHDRPSYPTAGSTPNTNDIPPGPAETE